MPRPSVMRATRRATSASGIWARSLTARCSTASRRRSALSGTWSGRLLRRALAFSCRSSTSPASPASISRTAWPTRPSSSSKRTRTIRFFLNYWAFSVHAPFDGKKDLIAKYRAKADPHDPQRCPVYGAMVQSLDENVGRLLDTLDELKLDGEYDHRFLLRQRRQHVRPRGRHSTDEQCALARRQGDALRRRHPRTVHCCLARQSEARFPQRRALVECRLVSDAAGNGWREAEASR